MFAPGHLIKPMMACAGAPGGVRCKTALVIEVELSHHEAVQVDSEVYHDKEVYECTLICKCGMFEEYDDRLEPIQ